MPKKVPKAKLGKTQYIRKDFHLSEWQLFYVMQDLLTKNQPSSILTHMIDDLRDFKDELVKKDMFLIPDEDSFNLEIYEDYEETSSGSDTVRYVRMVYTIAYAEPAETVAKREAKEKKKKLSEIRKLEKKLEKLKKEL